MFSFTLITPEGIKVDKEIYEAILPASDGEIAVLVGHKPLITTLKAGVVSLRENKGTPDSALTHIALSGGFAQIDKGSIRVMADSAERAEDIDELRAEEAVKKARLLKTKAQDDVSIAEAQSALERSLARLKVAELKKRRHGRG